MIRRNNRKYTYYDEGDIMWDTNDKEKKVHALIRKGQQVISPKEHETYVEEDEYGICATCSHLIVIKTRYDKICVDCAWFNKPTGFRIHRYDPPVECAGYWYSGWKALKDLIPLAMDIDNIIKRKVGFIHEEEEEEGEDND